MRATTLLIRGSCCSRNRGITRKMNGLMFSTSRSRWTSRCWIMKNRSKTIRKTCSSKIWICSWLSRGNKRITVKEKKEKNSCRIWIRKSMIRGLMNRNSWSWNSRIWVHWIISMMLWISRWSKTGIRRSNRIDSMKKTYWGTISRRWSNSSRRRII